MKLFLIILLIIPTYLFSQDTINQMEDGKKKGYWKILAYQRNLPQYDSSALYEEGGYIVNRKEGIWIRYYPDGKTKSKLTYHNGRIKGQFTTYFENGNIEEIGFMNGHKFLGPHQFYSEQGCLLIDRIYNQAGRLEDTVTYYRNDCDSSGSSGTIEFQYIPAEPLTSWNQLGSYQNHRILIDKRDHQSVKETIVTLGELKVVTRNGYKYYDQEGERIHDGNFKVYTKEDNILCSGDFEDGKLKTGTFYQYNKDGLIIDMVYYLNFQREKRKSSDKKRGNPRK